MANIEVDSPNVTYGDRYIEADYDYCTTRVEQTAGGRYKVIVFQYFFKKTLATTTIMSSGYTRLYASAHPNGAAGAQTRCYASGMGWE